jgi:hypothetical protein
MMLLLLGNSSALEPQPGTTTDSESRQEPVRIEGDQVTTIEVPATTPLDAALTEIKNVWALHSSADAPDWVDGNDDLLVRAVASTFGCEIGVPSDETEGDD